ncbi:type III PLP-dependent enzyme domain-containing protein [Actinotalea fermentans]|uniref:Alanine racemase n=1 Tax=Actinotalea fermentans TaxID=43671 RepID=A0A511YYY1_9CELL|nr:alanine racemase [Actinotalea fermentans]GEN80411.1 alanine racemase [Actinotalea fermentans]
MISGECRAAAADLPAPVAVVDLAAFDANAAELLRRAGGRPVRLATKSVRVPALVERALAAGFTGLMAYSVREAAWWARRGVDDVLLGYPSADLAALTEVVADPALRAAVTVMADDVAHLALLDRARAAAGAPDAVVRVCLDVDASLEPGPAALGRRRPHLGVRRSPLRTPDDAAALAGEAHRRGFDVRGLMFYEAQVAGLPDTSAAVRAVKRASLAELAVRRGTVVAAVTGAVGHGLAVVNGGGTGSLAATAADPAVTELTAGSGLLAPTLFDGYRVPDGGRALRPAAFLGLDVVRRPAPGVVTVFSGGYIASGAVGPSRAPTPVHPPGLRLTRSEGAGEVQTPLRGRAADGLAVGDRVWFRHAKAGEVMERFAEVALVGPARDVVPTYRGLGLTFG